MSIRISVDVNGLNLNLANEAFKIECPECKASNETTLGQVQRQETITCTNCGVSIRLVDEKGSVAQAIDNVNNAFGELRRALENLGT